MAKKSGIRRIYVRAKRRVSKASVPVVPVLGLGLLGVNLVSDNAGFPRNAAQYLRNGDWVSAMNVLKKSAGKWDNYVMPLGLVVGSMVVRKILGTKLPVTKRVSVL